ncbi:MAG: DPP IV N-terminal domain-containing protein [Bacteroidaceae bacterium]|nr:DPP IV N-terminal domain-containing protein [Bacteroidaceae bacterium]
MTTKFLTLLMTLTMGTAAPAQKLLTLEDVMSGGNNWQNLRPATLQATWWGNTLVQTTPDEAKDALTGATLVTVEQINDIVGEKAVRNGHYLTFPEAGQPLVMVKATAKQWLVDWQKRQVVWQQAIPDGSAHHDLSAARHLAYTMQGNLGVVTADGEVRAVTTDGSTDSSDAIVYGQSVHRNEFGIDKGTFWSPDGQHLAFYRMDQSMVPSYPQVDISQRIATAYTDRYPMAGEASHHVGVGIYHVATGQTTWLQLVGEKDDYHTNLSWSPDGSTLYIFELNRDQNHLRLVAYDVQTGAVKRQILEERHPKYVEPEHPLTFLPWDDSKAVMQSQRDGYNHLYLLDLKTASLTQLTNGPWVVEELLGFNRKARTLIYRSNEKHPLTSAVWSVTLRGKRTLLSTADGVHAARLSADGSQFVDYYTSPTVPRSINLVSTTGGTTQNLLTATDPWAEQGYAIPEITSGSIKAADGTTDLFFRMVKPIGFDATKQYPAVVYVYGGPHAHNVEASWHWGLRGWEAYMATKGFLVFVLDNRGSNRRGRDFEQATFRHLGDEEMKDQMQGVAYLQSLPYVDSNRLGVHGWSFGGFMTTNLMCTYPDAFKVGVAGGPVIDWKYYEVMYGERYMDTPQQNPEGYRQSSLLPKAGQLKGRLQIIFGYNDPTCVPQHTLSFVRACADAGTQPDLFLYPGDGHNMFGRDQIHLHERITRYFMDFLAPVAP